MIDPTEKICTVFRHTKSLCEQHIFNRLLNFNSELIQLGSFCLVQTNIRLKVQNVLLLLGDRRQINIRNSCREDNVPLRFRKTRRIVVWWRTRDPRDTYDNRVTVTKRDRFLKSPSFARS